MASRSDLNICGRELIRIRTGKGLSQEALATKCQLAGWDVSRDIIANIELRRRYIRDNEMAILAEVLEISLFSLFPRQVRARLAKFA